jgi:hypothetical protein
VFAVGAPSEDHRKFFLGAESIRPVDVDKDTYAIPEPYAHVALDSKSVFSPFEVVRGWRRLRRVFWGLPDAHD